MLKYSHVAFADLSLESIDENINAVLFKYAWSDLK